jgi:hypothetical protein
LRENLVDIPYGLKLWRALLLLCVLGAFASAAHAEGSVSALHMGYGAKDAAAMMRFDEVIAQYNASGERFRIDGHCQSACTMFLSIRNVCVMPSAALLFHSGGNQRRGPLAAPTQRMLSAYKPALQRHLTEHHYMDTLEFHAISGREIISRFGYPACR